MNFSDSDVLKHKKPSKDLDWWIPNIDHRITPKVRNTLEIYSGTPAEEVVSHVYNIRDQAWSIRPWPCTGMGMFFSSSLPKHPSYSDILALIQSGGHFLDIGCYCGTDLRQLMLDGCPQTNLHGVDLVNHWDLGYDLYRDRHKFDVEYIEADLLNPSEQMRALEGKIDVFGATHLLHNWDWETQVRAAANIVGLSKVGAMVVGFQVGTSNEGPTWNPKNGKEKPELHNLSTFKRLWEETAKTTGTKWNVESRLRDWQDLGHRANETVYLGPESRILEFLVSRTA
ncbi:hypothetical protein DM02DRAFT_524319 [Periconia macrospinosa]|uniref:Methyltransferase domain-containing protein n=1 Tax=Periconia macrospinosa TaxID=97972 RepID=A0A2V1DUP8_9PLEO|nr:hypothetical protein DM02DRAFT_524319 [Periconia macrospinosa]